MKQAIMNNTQTVKLVSFKSRQQGSLDCLCGVYSLVNATSYLRHIHSWKQQSQLMAKILEHMKAKGMTPMIARLTKEGTRLDEIASALKYIICPQYTIKRAKPYHHNPETTLQHFLRHCQGFLEQNKAIILIGIGGYHDHWTLIYRITQTRLLLHDSSQLKYLGKRYCCLPSENIQKTHVLYPTHTYFLWVE
jgi:hypothetical protein